MSKLDRLQYHVATDVESVEGARARPATTFRGGEAHRPAAPGGGFNSDEAAARFYLDQLLAGDERPTVRSVASPDRPETVPDLRHVATEDLPGTRTRLVRFQQTDREIPVYGAEVTVELDRRRSLVSATGAVGRPEVLSRVETLGRREALAQIAAATGKEIDAEAIPPPELVLFKDEAEAREDRAWHLAWFFREVPAAPTADVEADEQAERSFGLGGASLRAARHETNYLVDAHDGTILHHYSATPTLAAPTWCQGTDEDGASQRFFGNVAGTSFEMRDGTRHVVTYDFDYGDLAEGRDLPGAPVTSATSNWLDSARAAVSAHVNGARVHDFYKSVLQRDGIDGKGMDLVSVVKCRFVDPARPEPYPSWLNAEWYRRVMWYGQAVNGGTPVSLSRELDIIAHELTHGVIETTANLEYAGESGALNESFADIFGMIIRNWYLAPNRNDPATWVWALGQGFGQDDGPLRDLSDPASQRQPDHMAQYRHVAYDNGGVHINSGIHNKAAYNLLTARDANGLVFSVEESSLLFYLGLLRLTRRATFADARDAIAAATATLYAGDAAAQAAKVAAVRAAYAAVGVA